MDPVQDVFGQKTEPEQQTSEEELESQEELEDESEEAEAEAEAEEPDAVLEQLKALSSTVNALSKQVAQQRVEPRSEPKVEPKAETKDYLTISEKEADDMFSNPEVLTKKLNEALNSVVHNVLEEVKQYVGSVVPMEVRNSVAVQETRRQQEEAFWNKHNYLLQDSQGRILDGQLRQRRVQTVIQIANDLASRNPGLDIEQLGDMTAQEAIDVFGIAGKAVRGAVNVPNKVRLAKHAGKGSDRRKGDTPALSKGAADVEDTMSLGKGYRHDTTKPNK